MCAIGHRLVESGRSVLFIPAYRLPQDMLAAKRDSELPSMLWKLDNFDLLVLDRPVLPYHMGPRNPWCCSR